MPMPKQLSRPWDAAAAGVAAYAVAFILQWGSCLWAVYRVPFRGVLTSAWAWHWYHAQFVAWLQAAHLAALVPEAWCFCIISIAVGLFVARGVLNPKPLPPSDPLPSRNRHA